MVYLVNFSVFNQLVQQRIQLIHIKLILNLGVHIHLVELLALVLHFLDHIEQALSRVGFAHLDPTVSIHRSHAKVHVSIPASRGHLVCLIVSLEVLRCQSAVCSDLVGDKHLQEVISNFIVFLDLLDIAAHDIPFVFEEPDCSIDLYILILPTD